MMMVGRIKHSLGKINIPTQRTRADAEEREKMIRLEQAERELGTLQHRAYRAITALDDRQRRNHWRESIEQMIRGAG